MDVISGPPYPHILQDTYPDGAGVDVNFVPSLDLYAQPHNGHFALRPRHLKSATDTYEYFGHLSGKFVEPYTFMRRAAKLLTTNKLGPYDVVFDNQTLANGLLDIERAGIPVVGAIHHPITQDLKLSVESERRLRHRILIRRWYTFLKMQKRVARQLQRYHCRRVDLDA